MGISFFKINKHKSFNYKPVFYDPDKDKDLMVKKQMVQGDDELENMRSKIRAQWHAPKKKKRQKYPVTVIAFVIALLFTLIYWFFKM